VKINFFLCLVLISCGEKKSNNNSVVTPELEGLIVAFELHKIGFSTKPLGSLQHQKYSKSNDHEEFKQENVFNLKNGQELKMLFGYGTISKFEGNECLLINYNVGISGKYSSYSTVLVMKDSSNVYKLIPEEKWSMNIVKSE
jgi:hypothetical protein